MGKVRDDILKEWSTVRFVQLTNEDPSSEITPLIKKIEIALYLEVVGRSCFEALAGATSNSQMRKHYRWLAEEATIGHNQVRLFLEDRQMSHWRIEQRCHNYNLDPMSLPQAGILEIALRGALQRLEIYKDIAKHRMDDSKMIFNNAVARTQKEIKFLRQQQLQGRKASKSFKFHWSTLLNLSSMMTAAPR